MKILENIVYAIKEIGKVSKKIFFILMFLSIFSAIRTVINLSLIKYIVEYAISENFVYKLLLLWLTGYLLINLVFKIVLNIIVNQFIFKFETKLKTYTSTKIYNKILTLDLINYDNFDFYNKLNRAINEGNTRYFILYTQLLAFLINLITFGITFIVYKDPVIIILSGVSAVNYLLYYFHRNKKQYNFNKREEPYDRFKDYLNRIFYQREYAEELYTTESIKDRLLLKFDVETKKYINKYKKYLTGYMGETAFMVSVSGLLVWMAEINISIQIINGKMSIGNFLVMLNIVSVMSEQLINFFKIIPDIYQSGLYINDIKEILQAPSNFSEDGVICKGFENVELKNVYFKYNSQDSFVLHEINITINKNEIIAFAGLNGVGKSTIVDILTGLILPNQGRVMLNGIPYEQYKISSVRQLFGAVFQDFQIYEISIAENILMKKIASAEDVATVEKALKYVGLYDKVQKFDNGIYASVFNGGDAGFSGGEIQKIAIARAYASNAPVLIFDEPTSNLDVYATKSFYDAILGLKQLGKTIIFTTHKLYYTSCADIIFYIEHGTVVERGNHNELMSFNGNYAALFKMQSHELGNGDKNEI